MPVAAGLEQTFVVAFRVKPVAQVMHLPRSAAEQESQLLAAVHMAVHAAEVAIAVVAVNAAASASFPLPPVQAVQVPTVSAPVLAER